MPKRHPLSWAAALSVLPILTAIFLADLDNWLWILSLIPIAIEVVVLIAFVVLFLVHAVRETQSYRYVLASLIIGLAISGSWMYRDVLSADVRFFVLRPIYEARLADALAGRLEANRDGPLVAFYWGSGVVDNWTGLIYDPEDSLSLPRSRDIFGGDVTHIRKLSKGWFLCSFT